MHIYSPPACCADRAGALLSLFAWFREFAGTDLWLDMCFGIEQRRERDMESFKELFEMVKEYTRQYVIDSKELSEIAYQVWIKSLEPVSFDGNTAVLYIKAEFMKKIVEEKYLGLLTKAFEAVVGFPVKVEILCETSSNPEKKVQC